MEVHEGGIERHELVLERDERADRASHRDEARRMLVECAPIRRELFMCPSRSCLEFSCRRRDRREEAMNAERMRYMARQILRQRKLAEATATWQRELRDRAYVEIRRDEL